MRVPASWMMALLLMLVSATGWCQDSPVPAQERRGVEQTFLTFPEWFLVHSPAEYARLTQTRPAHEFPFVAHIGQLWSSYAAVIAEQLRAGYPLNPAYHVMIVVIAGSSTLEYGLRAVYENTIGRISWGMGGAAISAPERYGAMVAHQYVDFIREQPWYLFPFSEKLTPLWRTGGCGDGLRALERCYALSVEYAFKAAYATLIEKATRTVYEPAKMNTVVVLNAEPAHPVAGVELLKKLETGGVLARLPRYYRFRLTATELAQQKVGLTDVAGNRGPILVSAIAGTDFVPPAGTRVLFSQRLSIAPDRRRYALVMPVSSLSPFLAAPGAGVEPEHVYDY